MYIAMSGDVSLKDKYHHYAGFFSTRTFIDKMPSRVIIADEYYDVDFRGTYSYSYDGAQLHVTCVPCIISTKIIPDGTMVERIASETDEVLTYTCGSHDNRYPLVTYGYPAIKVTCDNYTIKNKLYPCVYGNYQFLNKQELVEFVSAPKPLGFKNKTTVWIKRNHHVQVTMTDHDTEVFNLHL